MKIIVCLDKNKGLAFNGRRQSRDRVLLEDIKEWHTALPIVIRPYSERLFKEANIPYIVSENPFSETFDQNYIFVEENLAIKKEIIDEVIIYNWNTVYPFDAAFYFDLTGFKLANKRNFEGYSHKKITKEVYKR